MPEVLVLGAGLSGLACAFELERAGVDVEVLEAEGRAGGVVGSEREQGFLFERGPNTIQASSRSFRELTGALGIADRLIATGDAARERLLFWKGKLHPLPRGPMSFLTTPLLGPRGKLAALSEPLRRMPRHASDAPEPTLAEFLEERLGEQVARRFAGAFVRGIYAGELDRLGARSAFPRLWSLAQERGGLVRGALGRRRPRDEEPPPGPQARRTDLLSFPEGLGELVDALAMRLGRRLHLGTRVERIARRAAGWEVDAEGSGRLYARRLVLALPARAAGALLDDADSNAGCGELLETIDLAPVTVAHLGFAPGALELPQAFGFLVPPEESERPGSVRALGILFPSRFFPGRAPEGGATVSAFYRPSDLGDDDPVACVREDLQRALGLASPPEPAVSSSRPWGRILPQYTVGHDARMSELLDRVRQAFPGVRLAGNYLEGVGVEQVITRGLTVARAILASD